MQLAAITNWNPLRVAQSRNRHRRHRVSKPYMGGRYSLSLWPYEAM